MTVSMRFEHGNPFCLNKGTTPVFLRCRGVNGSLNLKAAAGDIDKVKIVLKGKDPNLRDSYDQLTED